MAPERGHLVLLNVKQISGQVIPNVKLFFNLPPAYHRSLRTKHDSNVTSRLANLNSVFCSRDNLKKKSELTRDKDVTIFIE